MTESETLKDNMINILKNENRFFKFQGSTGCWYYDSFTHGLYKIGDSLVKAEKILKKVTKDIHKIPEKKSSAYVMVNTSNRCNLNCSYCYRNKDNPEINNIETVKKTLDFVTKRYKPNSKSYVISYSMTSESSVDLPLLKQIAEEYINYENYQFKVSDLTENKLEEFYSQLKQDLKTINDAEFPQRNKTEVITFLNKLLTNRNLIDLLNMSENLFDENLKSECSKRDVLAKWRLFRLNRWILEIKYRNFIQKNDSPMVTFWFMTNGTCAGKEYIDFVKSCDINPLWVSLDGPKQVHDYNRETGSGNGSYDTVIKNIQTFIENGIKIKVSAVITSFFPRPLAILKHVISLGINQISMTPVRPGKECSFTEENIKLLINGYEELFIELEQTALKRDFSLFRILRNDMSLASFYSFINRTKIYKRCDFDNQIVVNSRGKIYPCLYFTDNKDFCYGDIEKGIDAEKMSQNIIVTERIPCKDCWARYLCGGTCHYSAYVNTENYMGIDSVECKLKKYLAERSIKLLVFIIENNIPFDEII